MISPTSLSQPGNPRHPFKINGEGLGLAMMGLRLTSEPRDTYTVLSSNIF